MKETKNYGKLKAGEYYVGDWRYALGGDEELETSFVDALQKAMKWTPVRELGFRFKWEGVEVLTFGCDDGIYGLRHTSGSLEDIDIDTGTLCFIPMNNSLASDSMLMRHGTIISLRRDVEVTHTFNPNRPDWFGTISLGDLFEIQ